MKTYTPTTVEVKAAPSTAIRFAKIMIFTFATALAAQIKMPVPGSLVPITFQTAVVLLAGLSLGAKDGAFSQAAYLVFGALGMPFFAGAAGSAILFGATGGYLFGFVLAAFLIGTLKNKLQPKSYVGIWTITLLSSLVVFVPGVLVLRWFLDTTFQQAILTGFVPFIVGDLFKVTATTTLYFSGKRYFN